MECWSQRSGSFLLASKLTAASQTVELLGRSNINMLTVHNLPSTISPCNTLQYEDIPDRVWLTYITTGSHHCDATATTKDTKDNIRPFYTAVIISERRTFYLVHLSPRCRHSNSLSWEFRNFRGHIIQFDQETHRHYHRKLDTLLKEIIMRKHQLTVN